MIQSNNTRISLDRREHDSDVDFVSHAHTDHIGAVRASKGILASEQTLQLIEQAHNIEIRNRADGSAFEMVEAGHMLGSRQLVVNDSASGRRITYTGDFQTARSKTARPIKVLDTDVLIMDSTYPSSFPRFDDKQEVESAIQDWTLKRLRNGIVVFSAYAMGKAQELIAIFNDIGIKPLVSRKVSRVSRVYSLNGIRLSYSSAYGDDDYDSIVRDNFVGITDSRDLASMRSVLESAHGRKVYTAVATGFAKTFRFNTDVQFPLSDHADFSQSVDYIEETGAKSILTYGTNAAPFAENLRSQGYDAMPFCDSALARSAVQ
ncbi:MAG: hypothetical protein KGI06_04345 [Candidatus Micrarchaeota archaeon]|nr:hypothetical protein [Candidatus Micrarchaeota archaeon]